MSRPTDRGPILEPGIFSFWSWAPRGVHSTKGGSVCPSGWIAKEEEDRCDQPFPPKGCQPELLPHSFRPSVPRKHAGDVPRGRPCTVDSKDFRGNARLMSV